MPPLDDVADAKAQFLAAPFAEAVAHADHVDEVEIGAELLVRRAVHPVHHRQSRSRLPGTRATGPGRSDSAAAARTPSWVKLARPPSARALQWLRKASVSPLDFAAPELAPPRPGPDAPPRWPSGSRASATPPCTNTPPRQQVGRVRALAVQAAASRQHQELSDLHGIKCVQAEPPCVAHRVAAPAMAQKWKSACHAQSAQSCLPAARCPTPAAQCAVSAFVPRAIAGAHAQRTGFWIAASALLRPYPIREPVLVRHRSRPVLSCTPCARIRACCASPLAATRKLPAVLHPLREPGSTRKFPRLREPARCL